MTDDLADLHRLDQALDDLVAGEAAGTAAEPGRRPAAPEARRAEAPAEDQDALRAVDVLVATAAGFRAAVPPPSPEAASRGREAFLASAEAFLGTTDGSIGPRQGGRRRRLLLRVTALAAALLLIGVPAALARQAFPGSPLYPVREATQDARLVLTPSPVSKARILLDDAQRLRDQAVLSASSRDDCIRTGRAEVEEALAKLSGVTGAAAERQWVRAQSLLDDFRDLAEGKLPGEDHSGPGGGGDDRSGKGRGGDSGGDRHGGSGSSGSGGSGSGGGDDSGGSGSGSGGGSGSGSGSTPGGSGSTSGGSTSGGGGDSSGGADD